MTRSHTIKDQAEEARVLAQRAWVAMVCVLLAFALLLARFIQLQVVEHDQFVTQSEQNRISERPLPPTRGLIYDRNGRLLADNRLAYRLVVVPERTSGKQEQWLPELRRVLALSDDEVARFNEERKAHRAFAQIPLKLSLSEAEVARLATVRHQFPGISVVPYLLRDYPERELFAHVVGYMGRLDARDLERLDELSDELNVPPLRRDYALTSHIGKTGIEAFHELELHGRAGSERVETNAEGRRIRVLNERAPTPGTSLYLSLDFNLQEAAVKALAGRAGSVVAIEPSSGEILALVSMPSYDPNLFVTGISQSAFQGLLNDPARPLYNRAIQGGYPPGSTLKPFVGLAGLASGLRSADSRILSTGQFRLPGQPEVYRDYRVGGHGWVNLHEALAQSTNTYFYQLGVDLGIDRMSEFLAQFGFGTATGIDLRGEGGGVLPSRMWKRERMNQPWYPGETVICAIGQGYHVTTPLQLAHATATLANGGQVMQPRLVHARQQGFGAPREVLPPVLRRSLQLSPEHVQTVIEGMVAVMHGPTGTARAHGQGLSYQIAGKTGTAQTIGARHRDAELARFAHQALFVGFAPADAPRIALALVVEHGGSGSRAAAPLARAMFEAYLNPNAPLIDVPTDEELSDQETLDETQPRSSADQPLPVESSAPDAEGTGSEEQAPEQSP